MWRATIDFRVVNAEALDVEPGSFDFVCGLGVIHHLDLDASLSEVARVMKPSAGALFIEPLGHNPVINLYRRRTPEQRTVDEHPLVMDDLSIVRRTSRRSTRLLPPAGLLALPLVGRRRFDQMLGGLDAMDRVVFRRLRRYAWMMRCGSPVRGPSSSGRGRGLAAALAQEALEVPGDRLAGRQGAGGVVGVLARGLLQALDERLHVGV